MVTNHRHPIRQETNYAIKWCATWKLGLFSPAAMSAVKLKLAVLPVASGVIGNNIIGETVAIICDQSPTAKTPFVYPVIG